MRQFYQISFIVMSLFLFSNCQPEKEKQEADLLVLNANIYTVDSAFTKVEAMAIKDGKIIALGNSSHLKSDYKANKTIDAKGKTIIPGLYDAHAHFLEYGKRLREVDLRNTENEDEMLQRVVDFQKKEQLKFISGMGWDQNKWPDKKFPTKTKLDSLFPDTPVILTRIDGHAMLVNQKVLDLASIDKNTTIEGGTFVKENGHLTGVLIDNAREKVDKIIPKTDKQALTDALLRAQKKYLAYGVTTVADAGLPHEDILLMDELTQKNKLKIGLYPMLLYTDSHLDDYLFHGLGENKAVSCHAIKLFGDGALGSRGACLKKPYSDDSTNYGKMRVSPQYVNDLAEKVAKSNFQLNTHAIGDSTNHVVLKAYHKVLNDNEDRRWRVEHAQIVEPEDLHYFGKNIIPSVQSTHAISDMGWAEDRLGPKRIKHAYANKDLLNQAGIIALGTDAPIEEIDPYRTFYTAVARKNRKGEPKDGFQIENALSRKETLKAMTIWAAYSQFEDQKKGSLELGKQADFVILNQDIMQVDIDKTLKTKVLQTYIKGKPVYSKED